MSKKVKAEQVREKSVEYKTNVSNWLVIVHRSKYGYDVHCPALPGCASQGDTFEEALENIKDAIKVYLETVEELSKRQLNRNKRLEYVEVAV